MPSVLTAVLEPEIETRVVARVAPRYKVVMWDDDITTIEFVTELLVTIFRKDAVEARRLTLEVHESGAAVITITSLERGELYVDQVHSMARPRGFPLTATLEPE